MIPITFSDEALEDYADALEYYLLRLPHTNRDELYTLALNEFRTARQHPGSMQVVMTDDFGRPIRRVRVWHFLFFYRWSATNDELVVVRICHERSNLLP